MRGRLWFRVQGSGFEAQSSACHKPRIMQGDDPLLLQAQTPPRVLGGIETDVAWLAVCFDEAGIPVSGTAVWLHRDVVPCPQAAGT